MMSAITCNHSRHISGCGESCTPLLKGAWISINECAQDVTSLGWVQKRKDMPEFLCPHHATIRDGKEGASLAVPSHQPGIKGLKMPSYADLIKAHPDVYSEKGGEMFIELNKNSGQGGQDIGRYGFPNDRKGLSPTYLPVIPTPNGAPCNVSLKHANIVWNGKNWVFTTLKTHQGAAWVLRSYNETFENPTDFILRNGDVIRMGNHGYYITLVFYEV